ARGRHQQGLLLAGELALRTGARLFAQRSLQVAFDEAPLGPVDRRPAHPDAQGDILIADASVRSQQDLSPLELARRLLAAAQKRSKLVALVLGQPDAITYIHPCLLALRHGSPAESNGRREPLEKILHRQAGPIPGLYPSAHAVAPPSSSRNRHGGVFPR